MNMLKISSVLALLLFVHLSIVAQISPQFAPIPSNFNINSANPVYALDIQYDNIDTAKQAFHIFLPDTTGPHPLVIYIHGGGFRAGSRDNIFADPQLQLSAKYFLENNVALATIGYRLLPPQGANYTDSIGVIKCLEDSKRALQFIRNYASDLYIEPSNVALKGGSAGSGTGLWLATRPDMADPNSPDPVLQQSTRVCGAYIRGSQSTYDLYKWESQVFQDFDGMGTNYTVDSLVQLLGFDRFSDFYGGLDSNYHLLYDPVLIQYRQDVDMLYHMSSDDPSLYIHHPSPAVHPSEDPLHHSLHGVEIYDAALNASIPGVLVDIQMQGMNNTQGETGDEFLVRMLSSCALPLSLDEDLNPGDYTLYPNPVQTHLNIKGLTGDETFSVVSSSGKLIHQRVRYDDLEVSRFSSGMYLLIIDNGHARKAIRFVKE